MYWWGSFLAGVCRVAGLVMGNPSLPMILRYRQ
jgi:hypothetical protein